MLVLSRKIGEQIVIGGDVVITVTKASGNRVTIGIDAPPHISIKRQEIADKFQANDEPEVQTCRVDDGRSKGRRRNASVSELLTARAG
tara:strand:+ start:99863 stop:100126 length:264 start_codon:yes stop_codon:yes gene_type:complete